MPVAATAAQQTLAGNTTLTRTEFDSGTFVEALRRKLVVVPLGRRNDIPRNQGVVIRWQFMGNPSAATTALGEGDDPSDSEDIDATAVTATIDTYGDFFELSDLFEISTISGTRQEFVKAAGYQAALTLDTLCLTGTGSLADAAAGSITDVGTAVKAEDLRTAASALTDNDAQFHPGTPGGNFFCAVLSTAAAYDLIGEGAPTWYQAKAAAFEDNLTTPLQGTPASSAVHNCIVKMSSNIQTASSNDVMYVLAKDAFGVSSLASDILDPEVIIVPATPSLASPLGRRSTIGWKVRFARSIIDDNRLREILADE